MKRSLKVFGLISLYLLGWWTLLNGIIVVPKTSLPSACATPIAIHIFRFLPLYSIILFGLYSVISVIYKVSNFKDCPEAAKELDADIAEARTELKLKGFKFD